MGGEGNGGNGNSLAKGEVKKLFQFLMLLILMNFTCLTNVELR